MITKSTDNGKYSIAFADKGFDPSKESSLLAFKIQKMNLFSFVAIEEKIMKVSNKYYFRYII